MNGYLYTLNVRLTPLVRCEGRLATRVGSDGKRDHQRNTGPDVIVGLGGNEPSTGEAATISSAEGSATTPCAGATVTTTSSVKEAPTPSTGAPATNVLKGGPGTDTCVDGETLSLLLRGTGSGAPLGGAGSRAL